MIFKLGGLAAVAALGLSVLALQAGPADVPDSGVANEGTADNGVRVQVVPKPAMIPERLLDCTLGRITNFDASRIQKPSEYIFDGRHHFTLFLPKTPIRTTPPPESTAPPEPVDPETRIVADPDGLTRDSQGKPFDRVVDYWPDRVEMTKPISNIAVDLIIIDEISEAQSAATIFLTKANDAVTFDLDNLYYGRCRVKIGSAAT
ncbi:MAG: hypothetical protein ACR2PC_09640 [Tsuneonella suprasediminis]